MTSDVQGTPAGGPQPATEIQRSSRDPGVLSSAIQAWLASELGQGSGVSVSDLEATSANGMSSDTVLFTAEWLRSGVRQTARLVARIAPDPRDVPVFPSYDLRRQYEVMRRVGELSRVPVPRVWWACGPGGPLGAEAFVMDRVEGEVPPDVMPYTFGGNWLFDAAPQDRRRLERSTVEVLAELHAIDRPEERFDFLEFPEPGATRLRSHVAHAATWYRYACASGPPSPLIERAFAWLEDNWPGEEGPSVVSWGDSRIGNIMYRQFRPVAVLDWEMAGLGPRELDVAWLVYSHQVFQELAGNLGLPGMPEFLQLDAVATLYEDVSGQPLRNLDFYLAYAAVQWGIVGLRTGQRAVHFGEREMPEDVDELLLNRASLERMVSGRGGA